MVLNKINSFDSSSNKRVSFILVTLNRGNLINNVLVSARDYITENDELIIIDGGSIDNTLEVIEEHSDLVSVLISEKDISASNALNKGILISRGKYIRAINDDDVMHKDSFETAINILEDNNNIDLLLCGGTRSIDNIIKPVYIEDKVNYGSKLSDPLVYGACGSGFIIRRSSIAKIGLLPIGAACDIEYVVQCIANAGIVKFCRLNLFFHPIYEYSYTIKYSDEWYKDVDKICRMYKIEKPSKFVKKRKYNYKLILYPFYRVLPEGIKRYYRDYKKMTEIKNKSNNDYTIELKLDDIIWDGGFS